MISDECSNRFVPTAATDYWQCPAGIACQRAVFSQAFCRLCYVLRSGINNQQLNWVHVNFRKLDTRICFKSFQYATHRPTGVMCHSSTGIPENSRTRPHGELGPSQNSAPWRSRPRGELGPTENSAPTTAENSAPLRRTRPQLKFRPSACLVNMAFQHYDMASLHLLPYIIFTYEQSHMVLRKAVEDGFTHFYRKCGQRSARPLSTRDCHFVEFPQLRTMA